MNIFILAILLFFYCNENQCIGSSQEGNLQVRYSKVRYLPSNDTQKPTYRPFTQFWIKTENSTIPHAYNETRATSKRKTKKSKKKHKLTLAGINGTEIISPLNTTSDNTKTISLKLNGQSFNQNTESIHTMSNVQVRKFNCDLNNGGCAQLCNKSGDRKCNCFKGFILSPDDQSCLDIDECAINNGGCSHKCINSHGSYSCVCPRGLRIGDNMITCTDINECLLRNGHGPCQDTCTNIFGSYSCSCTMKGTRLGPDQHSCEDVNECLEGTSGCSHGCINIIGGSICTCPGDMALNDDLRTCTDFNEQRDEEALIQNCSPLISPRHGYLHCTQKTSGTSSRLDSVCELVCPNGYKTIGDYRVICRSNGTWSGPSTGKCIPISVYNFDHRKNYIDFIWDYPKPKITCSASRLVYIKKEQKLAYVSFSPPKTNIEWRYIVSYPPEVKTNLEAYLPQGHHWIVFKATHPETQLSAKCIISIIVKRELTNIKEYL